MAYDGTLTFDTSLNADGLQQGAKKLGDIVKGIGIFKILEKGVQMVADSVQAAFTRIDTMEQFGRVMTTMTGSADVANKALGSTTSIVKGTAYGLNVAAMAVQNFVSRGLDIDKSTKTVENWGNAVAFYGDGTNATFDSVTAALSKMQTRGKVTMEHMQMLLNAGIPALEIYGEAAGMTGDEVANAMSKGELKTKAFIDVMNRALTDGTARFPSLTGAAKDAGASWAGSFDNMRAAITRGTMSIIQGIDSAQAAVGRPGMRDGIALFGKTFEKVLNTVSRLIVPVVKNIDVLSVSVGGVAIAFGAYKTISAWSAAIDTAKKSMAAAEAVTGALTVVMGKKATAEALDTAATMAGAAATAGDTTAQLASTGAITLKTVLLGVMSGTMGVTTAATLVCKAATDALNASMLANPIGWIIAAIIVLIALIALLVMALSHGSDAYRKQKEEVKALGEEQKKLASAVNDSAAAQNEKMTALLQEEKQTAALIDRLKQYFDVNEMVSGSHKDAQLVVDDLNRAYAELNLSYNKETKELSTSIVQIERYIQAKESQSRTAALDERRIELASEQAKIEAALVEIAEKRKIIEQEANLTESEKAKLIKELDKTVGNYGETQTQLRLNIQANNAAISNSTNKMADQTVNAHEAINGARTEDGQNLRQLAKDYDTTTDIILADMAKQGISMQEWADRKAATLTEEGMNIELLAQKWGMTTEQVQAYMDEWGMGLDEFAKEMESTHTKAGLSLEDLAAKWGTSTTEIKNQMALQNISLQEWSDQQDAKTEEVINSFKKIPKNYELTANQMIDVLQTNAVRYSKWTENIATLSQTMSAEAIAELQKLGPEANSAIEQMIADPTKAAKFEESIVAVMSAGASGAEIGATDPRFSEAGTTAKDSIADSLANTEKATAAGARVVESIYTGAETALETADFKGLGQKAMQGILEGINETDLSSVAETMAANFEAGATRIETAVSTMATNVKATLQTIGTEATATSGSMDIMAGNYEAGSGKIMSTVSSLKTQIGITFRGMDTESTTTMRGMIDTCVTTVQTGSTRLQTAAAACKNTVLMAFKELATEARQTVFDMMDGILTFFTSGNERIEATAKAGSENVLKNLASMKDGAIEAASSMMDGMLVAMGNKEQSLYNKANEIAQNIIRTLRKAFDIHSPSRVTKGIFEMVMQGGYVGMDDNEQLWFDKADDLASGLKERFTNIPANLLGNLQSSVLAGRQLLTGQLAQTPSLALAGGGTVINHYNTNFEQVINAPKALSASENSRTAEDMLSRKNWQIK